MHSLGNPLLCPSVEPIFFFLLLGVQHSESVFQSVVKHLPRVLTNLDQNKQFQVLARLGEASHFMIIRFPDFPDLYNPVLQVLKKLDIQPPNEERVKGKSSDSLFFVFLTRLMASSVNALFTLL